jgi:hypothetical protein
MYYTLNLRKPRDKRGQLLTQKNKRLRQRDVTQAHSKASGVSFHLVLIFANRKGFIGSKKERRA